jgi:hypothetical protein
VDHMFTLPLHLLHEGRPLFFHHTNLGKIPIFLSKNPPQHIELETITMAPPHLHNYFNKFFSLWFRVVYFAKMSSPTFLLNSFFVDDLGAYSSPPNLIQLFRDVKKL